MIIGVNNDLNFRELDLSGLNILGLDLDYDDLIVSPLNNKVIHSNIKDRELNATVETIIPKESQSLIKDYLLGSYNNTTGERDYTKGYLYKFNKIRISELSKWLKDPEYILNSYTRYESKYDMIDDLDNTKLEDLNLSLIWKDTYNTHLQNTYNISKRTANTIINLVEGEYNKIRELKIYFLNDSKEILKTLESKKEELDKEIKELIKLFHTKGAKQTKLMVINLDNLKTKVYYLNKRIIKLENRIQNLQLEVDNNKYKYCIGSLNLFKKQYNLEDNGYKSHQKWLNEWRRKRNRVVSYLGSKDETYGNLEAQLSYDYRTNSYNLELKDMLLNQRNKNLPIIKGIKVKDKNLKSKLRGMVLTNECHTIRGKKKTKNRLTVYIKLKIGKNNKVYLDILVRDKEVGIATDRSKGCISLDYNVGFITITELDSEGKLLNVGKVNLDTKKQGKDRNKAKEDLSIQLKKIVKYCKTKGKPVYFEDLNFTKTRTRISKWNTKDRKYNNMVSSLSYSKYKKSLIKECLRQEVGYGLVNPYKTSDEGSRRYSELLNLDRHESASLLIGRLGLGYK